MFASAADIPTLSNVDTLKFYSEVTNETYQQAEFSDVKLNFAGPVQVVGITLGEQHSVAWLEQTPTDKKTRLGAKAPGVRVMQLSFGANDGQRPKVNCVGGAVGKDSQVRQLPIITIPNFLEYRYWDSSKPNRGEVHTYGYSKSARGFIKTTPELTTKRKEEKLKELSPVESGRLELRNVTSKVANGCDRRYSMGIAESGNLEITAAIEFTIGLTRISYTTTVAIDEISSDLEVALLELLQEDLHKDTKLLTNGNMVGLWFPGTNPQALVIDLDRMEREFLIHLITETQELLNEYDFAERKFVQASYLLGRLNLISRFATSVPEEIGIADSSRIKTGASKAIANLEELIFRLPVQIGTESWNLFYNARTNKGRLLPTELNWKPKSEQAFQLKIANRPLTLLMILQPTSPLALESDDIAALKSKLADENRHEPFRMADIQVGFPKESSALLSLPDKSDERKSSIKLHDFKVIQPDQFALKISSSESDAQELRELYLRSVGLPLRISLDRYFHSQMTGDQTAVTECRVKAPDFKIITAQDQFLPITVLVDTAAFNDGSDEFNVRLRYPGETQEFTGIASKQSGTAAIEIPVRTKESEVQLEIQFWSPGRGEWLTEATGAEGLIIIDR